MDRSISEMTIMVPVSQYVKVEAEAAERSQAAEPLASFLLSEWVHTTFARRAAAHHEGRHAEGGVS